MTGVSSAGAVVALLALKPGNPEFESPMQQPVFDFFSMTG